VIKIPLDIALLSFVPWQRTLKVDDEGGKGETVKIIVGEKVCQCLVYDADVLFFSSFATAFQK